VKFAFGTEQTIEIMSRRYGTPDSVISTPPYRMWSSGGSDEVNRLQWGDRGVGVGHFWEPAFHEPDSRLPQVPSHSLSMFNFTPELSEP
jgi:hypothetical protein